MEIYTRLQSYTQARAQYKAQEIITVPPFTLIVHGELVYALPQHPITGADEPLQNLRRICAEHDWLLHVEFIEEFTPGLGEMLEQLGMSVNLEEAWLVATPSTLREPPAVPGITFVSLSSESDLEDVREGWNANVLGFDPQGTLGSDEDIEGFRRKLVTSRAFTTRLDSQPVGSGMYSEIYAGVAELIGISTLAGYRRRGIAALTTAHIAQSAFAAGVEVAYLTAAHEEARRIYERLGFNLRAHYRLYQDAR